VEADRPGLPVTELGAAARPSPGTAAGYSQSLFKKLVWLTLFRLVMVTVLLGVSAFTAWKTRTGADETISHLYLVIGATYVASLGFVIMLRMRIWLHVVAYGQIALDVGIASAVVALTGYSDSVFLFLFLLGIVNGSILLFQRGAVVSALLALGSYLFVVLALDSRVARVLPLTLFVHASAFALTAALASYLAAQLQRTGERLEARESDFAALTALHEAIVQSVEAGLLTVDESGRVSFLNKAGAQMTGLSLAEIRGQPAMSRMRGARSCGSVTTSSLSSRPRESRSVAQSSFRISHACAPWRSPCSGAPDSPISGGWPPAWHTSCETHSPP
jgi:two-component system sensor histidine kinase PilS (NtrC family)